MYLGKVIGTVVSTVKAPSLTGSKFLIVEKINQDLTAKKQTEKVSVKCSKNPKVCRFQVKVL